MRKDEAAEIMAHFQRLDLISLAIDKSKREVEPYDDRDVIIRVEDGRGGVSDGHSDVTPRLSTASQRKVDRWLDGTARIPLVRISSPARDDSQRLGDDVPAPKQSHVIAVFTRHW